MVINTRKMLNELRETGKVKCPLCNKGYFQTKSDIPFEKQKQFFCTFCKEEWYLNYKIN